MERLPVRRHARRLSLFIIAAILITALPGLSVAAESFTPKPLDDTQTQFAEGTFQRTSVSSGTAPAGSGFSDEDGALQLSAVGFLNDWEVVSPGLPIPLASHGVTIIGDRLYTVGGATTGANSFTDAVFWTAVDQQTGSFKAHGLTTPPSGGTLPDNKWVNQPLSQIPAFMSDDYLSASKGCAGQPIKARQAPAVASFVTSGGTPKIYVIGGSFQTTLSLCPSGIFSSPAVQIGTVDPATGFVTWSAAERTAYLPSPDIPGFDGDGLEDIGVGTLAFGVEGATASILSSGGKSYLYVVGGIATYPDLAAGNIETLVTPAVFYTRLNPGTGAFEYPLSGSSPVGSPWARAANLPLTNVLGPTIVPGDVGLFDHTAVVSRATAGSGVGTTVKEALFVMGGYTVEDRSSASSFVFRATIKNADTGELEWASALDQTRPGTDVSMEGQVRGGPGGFAYGGKIYALGGSEPDVFSNPPLIPLGSATVAVHDDNHNLLPLFNGAGTGAGTEEYFIGTERPQPLFTPALYNQAGAVIPAKPLAGQAKQTGAWGYAIGGRVIGGTPIATIYRGKIGGEEETSSTQRTPEGWFYSRFFDIRLENNAGVKGRARVVAITWNTLIDRQRNSGADMRVEFRQTNLFPCSEAAFEGAQWRPLDALPGNASLFSQSGSNRVELSEAFGGSSFTGSCFQYRLFMTQNGSTAGVPTPASDVAGSPKLYNINIETVLPGEVDLQVSTFEVGVSAAGKISTFNLVIKNLAGTLDNTIKVQGGQFPTVLCVAYSASDPNVSLTPPALPISGDTDSRVDCAPIYRWVDPTETDPGSVDPGKTYAINSNWKANYSTSVTGYSQDQSLSDVREAFATPGYYAVAALIDPFGLVNEGGQGKANNTSSVVRFQVRSPGVDTTTRVYLPFLVR